MNVFRVELRRFASRRLVHVLLIVTIAGIAVSSTIAFFQSHEPDARLQRRLERHERYVEECLAGERKVPGFVEKEGPGGLENFCEVSGPYAEDPRFRYKEMDEVLMFTSPIWVMLALVAGASFIGAEWHTGNIGTTLTWESRRVRLFIGKALACAVGVFVITTLLQLVLALFLAPVALLRGTTAGLSGEAWADIASVGLRASMLAMAGGLIGYALASIGRNTGAALGIMFSYSAVIENAVRGFKPHWFGWLLTDNALTFMSGDTTLSGAERSTLAASLAIAAYVMIPLLAGLYLFQRRDVT